MKKSWEKKWVRICLFGCFALLLIGFSLSVTAEETAVATSSGRSVANNENLTRVTHASSIDRSSSTPSVNADGSKIVFSSDSDFLNQGISDGQNEIWLYNTTTAALQRITTASASDRTSTQPSISGDGTKIVFRSDSDFLSQGITRYQSQIWLYDMTTQNLTRVTTTSDSVRNADRPHISSDGNRIVFNGDFYVQGSSDNLREIWLYKVDSGGLTRLTTASSSDRLSISPRTNSDGSKVVFVSDSDFLNQGIPSDQPEIWLMDVGTMDLTRITTASEFGRWSLAPDIDDSGNNIVFQSDSDLLGQGIEEDEVEVWQYNASTSQMSRITTVSPGLSGFGDSIAPRISGNGRYIVFESLNDFTGQYRMGISEIWLYDTVSDSVERLTYAPDGISNSNTASFAPDINATGSSIVFHSSVDFTNDTTQKMPTEVWLYGQAIPQASLALNYSSGAPGSYFSVTGENFPPNETATITVNGHVMGTMAVDGNGRFLFIFTTANANEGTYVVTATVNPTATTQFTISIADPMRPQEDSGDTFDIPAGIAFNEFLYLPSILK